MALGIDTHPGGEGPGSIKWWWVHGPGLQRWAGSPHPWTTLYTQLRKHMSDSMAKRSASLWFHEVFGIWSGERKGANPTGPG